MCRTGNTASGAASTARRKRDNLLLDYILTMLAGPLARAKCRFVVEHNGDLRYP